MLERCTFNYSKFMSLPRCTKVYLNFTGAGCSLTAFWYALGFKPSLIIKTRVVMEMTEKHYDYRFTHEQFGVCSLQVMTDATNLFAGDGYFTTRIIKLHDEGLESEAIRLLLELVKTKGLEVEEDDLADVNGCNLLPELVSAK